MAAVMTVMEKPPSWSQAKVELNDPSFLTRVKNFDKDSITNATLKKIEKFTKDPSFAPPNVQKVSRAAGALCLWVHAMQMYAEVYREVEPKRLKLRLAEEELEKKQSDLRLARKSLEDIQSRLEELNNQYDESLRNKSELNSSAEELRVKLERAESLITGLADERDRWELSLESYKDKLGNIPGDALLGSAFMSYAGPFTSTYRSHLVKDLWMSKLQDSSIPCSADFDFTDFFVTPVDVRQWQLDGLPTDPFSAENGVLITKASKWPLIIDPQNQANRWIRKLKSSQITVVDPESKSLLRILHLSVQTGRCVLLERLQTQIDPSLEPIITKNVVDVNGKRFISIGEQLVPLDDSFSLWMTTKIGNPLFPPEIEAEVTLINFVIMQDGLTEQLLGIVVMKEEPSLEAHKHALVLKLAEGRKRLQDIEDQILRLLTDARGCLLDDLELIRVLQDSKRVAGEVSSQIEVSERTMKKIDQAREAYRYARQGMFERHKPLLSLHLCASVLLADDQINRQEYAFLFTHGGVPDSSPLAANPDPEWITPAVWQLICKADQLEGLQGLQNSIEQNIRIIPAASRFVTETMDSKFVENSPLDWEELLSSSKSSVPLLFILSGVDPIGQLTAFATSKNTTSTSEFPWDAVRFRIAGACYGGRLTDERDMRLLRVYCNDCLNPQVLANDFKFQGLQQYPMPEDTSLTGLRQYVRELPAIDPPELFGQHVNAEIQSQIEEAEELFATLLSIQHPGADISDTGDAETRESRVLRCCDHLESVLPNHLDIPRMEQATVEDLSPLRVVMIQEAQRLNRLLACVTEMVRHLKRGVAGLVVMSEDLEALQCSLLSGKVPPCWEFAFPSLKPLSSWALDLSARVDQISKWGLEGQPKAFWLGGLTYPGAFLTALLQQFARRNSISVDTISFEFVALTTYDENTISSSPRDGAYVKRLYLEGASWNVDGMSLREPEPMQLICEMPIVHFKPVARRRAPAEMPYMCPIYQYPCRAGKNGRPSLVTMQEIRSGAQDPSFWAKRGTAILLSTAS
ncbi:Dynein heavy chain 3, axonemal, related [Eimeria maxima]|uniref:Dynein heavy chain 3, axonemal, related n=1 Tax=Eimeria maxima TaxID=5804 RepID=U6M2L9_EIMMA|nr:Dynein heavy chain 3, axonemal, related [Eimeria maxima]CDJ55935.1 Dynein heavy chain 3, axonemal, related [Eimeria maxima]